MRLCACTSGIGVHKLGLLSCTYLPWKVCPVVIRGCHTFIWHVTKGCTKTSVPHKIKTQTHAPEVCVHQGVLCILGTCLPLGEGRKLRAGVTNQVDFGSLCHRHEKQMAQVGAYCTYGASARVTKLEPQLHFPVLSACHLAVNAYCICRISHPFSFCPLKFSLFFSYLFSSYIMWSHVGLLRRFALHLTGCWIFNWRDCGQDASNTEHASNLLSCLLWRQRETINPEE